MMSNSRATSGGGDNSASSRGPKGSGLPRQPKKRFIVFNSSGEEEVKEGTKASFGRHEVDAIPDIIDSPSVGDLLKTAPARVVKKNVKNDIEHGGRLVDTGSGGGGGGGHQEGDGGRGGTSADAVDVREDVTAWEDIRDLMSDGDPEQEIQHNDNWNKLFQDALELPENTEDECYRKWRRLTTVNKDFVAAAVTYGMTIISEYFLNDADKSIKLQPLGGEAGGKKFLWRGIMFKLADGSKGPYSGSDEAAAKGAGHDMRGATHYLGTRIRGLHFALQCLIDYKGFRMNAQAQLPVNSSTLRYGTSNGCRSVHCTDTELNKLMKETAQKLNLRAHMVKDKSTNKDVEMHSACDVEGHEGTDGRRYLLDFSRTFPPESPCKVEHLSEILTDGTLVYVQSEDSTGVVVKAMLKNAGRDNIEITYKVRLDSSKKTSQFQSHDVKDLHMAIYWRMLRPEFVKGGNDTVDYRPDFQRSGTTGVVNVDTMSHIPEGPDENASVKESEKPTVSEGEKNDGVKTVIRCPPEPGEYVALSASSHGANLTQGSGGRTSAATASVRRGEASPPPPEGERKEQAEPLTIGSGSDSLSEGKEKYEGAPAPKGRNLGVDADFPDDYEGRRTPPRRGVLSEKSVSAAVGHYEVFLSYETDRRGSSRVGSSNSWNVSGTRSRLWSRDGSNVFLASSRRMTGNGSAGLSAKGSSNDIQGQIGGEPIGRPGSMIYTVGSEGTLGGARGRPAPRRVVLDGSLYDGFSVSYGFYESSSHEGSGGRTSAAIASVRRGEASTPPPEGEREQQAAPLTIGSGSDSLSEGKEKDEGAPAPKGRNLGLDDGYEGRRTPPKRGVLSEKPLSATVGHYEAFLSFETDQRGSSRVGSSNSWNVSGTRSRLWSRDGSNVFLASSRRMTGNGSAGGDQRGMPSTAPQGVAMADAAVGAAEGARAVSLSPDALSGFSKDCPDSNERQQEIHDATEMMINFAVPAVANWLMGLPDPFQEELDLAVELHRHGVNVRHLGKVRSHVPLEDDYRLLRDMMLTEMIARTLKNILRCFQRKWMKAQRSTSEQGMSSLAANFLNLVTGYHHNSAAFWEEHVLTGLLQRFGLEALTRPERKNIWKTCVKDKPEVLEFCISRLTKMQGLMLTPEAEADFFSDQCPIGFKFVVSDIQEIRPIVRYMHILDYGGGVMLNLEATRLQANHVTGSRDDRTLARLHDRANQHFIAAHQSLPDDMNTRQFVMSYSQQYFRQKQDRHDPPSPGPTPKPPSPRPDGDCSGLSVDEGSMPSRPPGVLDLFHNEDTLPVLPPGRPGQIFFKRNSPETICPPRRS